MIRVSFFHRSPLLMLAAALVALTVFFVQDTGPAEATVQWSSTLTVANSQPGLGCNDDTPGAECSSQLTDNDFIRKHQVAASQDGHVVRWVTDTFRASKLFVDAQGTLVLRLELTRVITKTNAGDPGINLRCHVVIDPKCEYVEGQPLINPGRLFPGTNAVLRLNGIDFPLPYEIQGQEISLTNSGLSWSDGDTVQVYLVNPNPAHVARSKESGDSSLNPTGLRAFPGKDSLTLAWSIPDTDDRLHFMIRWKKTGTSAWLNTYGRPAEYMWVGATGSNYTYTITGLEDGVSYDAQVRAYTSKVDPRSNLTVLDKFSEWVTVTGAPGSTGASIVGAEGAEGEGDIIAGYSARGAPSVTGAGSSPSGPSAVSITASGHLREGGPQVNVYVTLDRPALAAGALGIGTNDDNPATFHGYPRFVKGGTVAVWALSVPEDDIVNGHRVATYGLIVPASVTGGEPIYGTVALTVIDNDGIVGQDETPPPPSFATALTLEVSEVLRSEVDESIRVKVISRLNRPALEKALMRVSVVGGTATTRPEATADNPRPQGDFRIYNARLWIPKGSANPAYTNNRGTHDWLTDVVIYGDAADSDTIVLRAETTNPPLTSNELTLNVGTLRGGPPNQAPTVVSPISDISGLEPYDSRTVSLSGVFSDPDGDELYIDAESSNDDVVSVLADVFTMSVYVVAVAEGTATITVTAEDTSGNRVSDTFDVSVVSSQGGTGGDIIGQGQPPPPDQQPERGQPSTEQEPERQEPEDTPTPTPEPTPTPTPEPEETETQEPETEDTETQEPEDTPTPTPEPTPTPTPEPETSDIVARYDVNGDGQIDPSEWAQAKQDFVDGKITYSEMMEVAEEYLKYSG